MSEISGRLGSTNDDETQPIAGPPFDEVDERAGHWLRRHRAGSVAVVTTMVEGGYRGTTLSAWIVASFDPVQLLLSLEEDSPMADWIAQAGFFALSILSWRDQFFADQFAGFTPRASSAFEGIDHFSAPSGAPVLSRCIAWADCGLAQSLRTGDHVCLCGDVRAAGAGEGDEADPLIYYLQRYRRTR
jgi:flavin reductase (DIM6/NTAB) family NADH-FMN oxidoreductase RutF